MRALPALIVAFAPTLAAAQSSPRALAGGWFDGGGSEVGLPSRSFVTDPLKPSGRPFVDLVDLFRDACLRVVVGTSAARPAIDARSSWNFRFLDADAGTTPGARLDGWQAEDVSVSSQDQAWPLAECNVTADRVVRDDLAPVVTALSGLLNAQPDKNYRARATNGRKLDGDVVRWTVAGPRGAPRHVYASSYTDLNGSFMLHLGLTEARLK